jgi:catechol 2,3-dioxygenase
VATAQTDPNLAGYGRPAPGEVARILRLGHVDVSVRDLEEARTFYVDVLGYVEAHREPGRLYLRALEEFDQWSLCLTAGDAGGLNHVAFRVESPDDLEKIARLHDERGLPVVRVAAGEEPGQGDAVRVRSGDGFPVEFYHHMDQIPVGRHDGRLRLPMRMPGMQRGVRPLRIDHVNIRPSSMDESLRYWVGTLGFSISEYVQRDGGVFAAWTRRTTGTHEVALMQGDARPTIHHFAYALPDMQSVVAAADVMADAGFRDGIDYGPGRHGLSNAMYLYVRDPSGNRIELFTADYHRDLDMEPIGWSWEDYDETGRLWWRKDMPDRFREVVPVDEGWPGSP